MLVEGMKDAGLDPAFPWRPQTDPLHIEEFVACFGRGPEGLATAVKMPRKGSEAAEADEIADRHHCLRPRQQDHDEDRRGRVQVLEFSGDHHAAWVATEHGDGSGRMSGARGVLKRTSSQVRRDERGNDGMSTRGGRGFFRGRKLSVLPFWKGNNGVIGSFEIPA